MPVTEKRLAKIKGVLDKKQPGLVVVLENVHDPHNISAVLRTCDATGVYEIHIVHTDSSYGIKFGKKSSASAFKWSRVIFHDNVETCFSYLKERDYKIFTTSLTDGAVNLYEMDLTKPVALVFGNERLGVSKKAVDMADGNFHIPQHGMIESLNISVACAVTLYEALRQRTKEGLFDSKQLNSAEYSEMLEDWIKK